MPDKIKQDPEVIRLLRQYRLSLIGRENEQIKRLAKEWLVLEYLLKDEMTLLALEINEAKLKGYVVTEQLLRRMSRYEKLNQQMKLQILEFVKDTAIPDIKAEQLQFGLTATQSASEAIRMTGALGIAFDRLPVDAVETYVGMLGDGTPLYRLLKEAYPDALDGVVKSLLEGTAKGLNPNQVAYQMSKAMGMGLERITLIARTEQLRVNRLVSAQQYRTSGLDGYMRRVATKDNSVCMACLVSDGEIIQLDQELDDHPRGRCIAVFQIKGSPAIQWEKGTDWFEKQSEETQREMMGDKRFELWKDGKFDLSQLRKNNHSDIWGNSPKTASINELINILPVYQQTTSIKELSNYISPNEASFPLSANGGLPLSRGANLEDLQNKEYRDFLENRAAKGNTVEILPPQAIEEFRTIIQDDRFRLDQSLETFFGMDNIGAENVTSGNIMTFLGSRTLGISEARVLNYAGEGGKVFRVVLPKNTVAVAAQVFDFPEVVLLPGSKFEILSTKEGVTTLKLLSDGSTNTKELIRFQDKLNNLKEGK